MAPKIKQTKIPAKKGTVVGSDEGTVVESDAETNMQTNEETPEITRTLELLENGTNIIDDFLDKSIFTKDEGTPQKRIYYLFRQILYINKTYGIIPQSSSSVNILSKINTLISNLSSVKRESLPNLIQTNSKLIHDFINLFRSSIEQKEFPFKMKTFISLWISILVKSISDVSLCGSLVNLIPEIYAKIGKPLTTIFELNTNRKDPKIRLEGNINLVYFSSDTITGSGSTNIVKLLEYPIQILYSTKRSGITTQTIILQKNIISILSIILSSIGTGDENMGLPTELLYDPELCIFLIEINKIVYEFCEKLNVYEEYLEIQLIQNKIQKAFDNLFNYQNRDNENTRNDIFENIINNLYTLILQISGIHNFFRCLNKIQGTLVKLDKEFIINRWTYHLSNDIFKYNFPLYKELFTETRPEWGDLTLKDIISIEEILTATYDAMYGHDFPFDFIQNLGDEFLNLIGSSNRYKMSSIPSSLLEKACINQTVGFNNYSTLNQHDDKFSIILNSEHYSKKNFLTASKEEMYVRNPQTQWNISLSPLLYKQKLYSSVDFVSGEPAISLLLTEQVNYIKNASDSVYFYEIANEDVLKNKTLEISNKINQETKYNEIFNPCSLFDGAAPWGGKPIYFLEGYISKYIITIRNKKTNELVNYKFSIITETILLEENLNIYWVQNRIDETKQIKYDYTPEDFNINLLTPSLIMNLPEYYQNNVKKFNKIWGTILNSNIRLSNDTKENIVDTFRKIIGNIEKVNTPQEQSVKPRGRRNQHVIEENNYFDNNEQFNNNIIEFFISMVKPIIEKNKKKFKDLMDVYSLIIIKNQEDENYQNQVTNFLKILEMCIRKTVIENPRGIFIELHHDNNETLQTEQKNKILKKFEKESSKIVNRYLANQNSIIIRNGILKNELDEARRKSQSVPGTIDTNMSNQISSKEQELIDARTQSNIQEVIDARIQPNIQESTIQTLPIQTSPVPSPINQFDLSPASTTSNQSIGLSLAYIPPSQATLHDSQVNHESDDFQEQGSVASSSVTQPFKTIKITKKSSPRNSPRSSPRSSSRLQNRNNSQVSSVPRYMQGTKSSIEKRKKGGTFKKYQNKFKYSIKNRLQLKNKSIKNNKRKHTKTYKRK